MWAERIGEAKMQKPRKLTPRPRMFDSPGSKNKPVERKPEVLPADDEQQQEEIKKAPSCIRNQELSSIA
jgi:hypothetical protein